MIKQLFSAAFLLAVFVAANLAQGSVEDAVKSSNERFSDVKNRSLELERMKRDAVKRPTGDNSSPGLPLIKEDFETIQVLTGEILKLTAAESSPDYAAVYKIVSEVNQRSVRLKSNLFADEIKSKKDADKRPPTASELRDIPTLANILKLFVNRFANSSLFQNVNLVNSDDSLKAQKDLETVIKISSSIKEKAKKLKKQSPKN